MSARHDHLVRQRLRQIFRDDARLTQLRHMTATGEGITRIPRKVDLTPTSIVYTRAGAVARVSRTKYAADPAKHSDMFEGERIIIRGTGIERISYPHETTPPVEISMEHYRELCREKQELETKLHNYVVGHSFFVPHISPFGADRFRPFDPLPVHELIVVKVKAKVQRPAFNRIYC